MTGQSLNFWYALQQNRLWWWMECCWCPTHISQYWPARPPLMLLEMWAADHPQLPIFSGELSSSDESASPGKLQLSPPTPDSSQLITDCHIGTKDQTPCLKGNNTVAYIVLQSPHPHPMDQATAETTSLVGSFLCPTYLPPSFIESPPSTIHMHHNLCLRLCL